MLLGVGARDGFCLYFLCFQDCRAAVAATANELRAQATSCQATFPVDLGDNRPVRACLSWVRWCGIIVGQFVVFGVSRVQSV